MAAGSGRAFARAALAGNPSDAYGGAVLAVVVREFAANVRVEEVAASGADEVIVAPPSRLIEGTIERFLAARAETTDFAAPRLRATWTTSIPREVGLGGSSALVTATLRALAGLFSVRLEPAELAATALATETAVLGIAAGPQDRVAQAYEGLTYMDFRPERLTPEGHGSYEQLDPALLPPLYLAYREDSGEQSGATHRALGERFAAGDAALCNAMERLASHADGARAALVARDAGDFGACVDASFDVRREIVALDPRHVAMVQRARALGASANYTGSGGAIVGTCADEDGRLRVIAGLSEGPVRAIALTTT